MSRRSPNRAMFTDELRSILGLNPKRLLPTDAREGTYVDGYLVRVLPSSAPAPTRRRSGHRHRIQAECPFCASWIPAGRLAQHEPACYRRPR